MIFVKGLAAFAVGLFIVVGLALHPSINAYHTGFAGLVVSAIFIGSTLTGTAAKRSYVLVAVLFMAFLEPDVKITNSLQFSIVSNGLIIGAISNWFIEKPKIAKSSLPIIAAIAGMFSMTLAVPILLGAMEWIHIHDALMFVKYGIVAVLAFSVIGRDVKSIVIVLAISSAIVAAVSIIQAFNISWFGQWMYETYFSANNISDDDIGHLSTVYARSRGLTEPISNALFLVMSLGAWFVLMIRSKSTRQMAFASLGISAVLLAIYLTGSRLGLLEATPALALGLVW